MKTLTLMILSNHILFFSVMSQIIPYFSRDATAHCVFIDGAFKKLPTPTSSSLHLPSHHNPAACPTPARRRHRTTFTQEQLQVSAMTMGWWDGSVGRALWDSGIAQWVEHCGRVG